MTELVENQASCSTLAFDKLKKIYFSTITIFMATKRGRVVTYR